MLSIVTLSGATSWRAYRETLFGWPSYTHLKGVAIGEAGKGPKMNTRVLRNTGVINQLWPYGDSSQVNHGVVHRDVDGMVYPNGLAMNGDNFLVGSEANGLYVFSTGDYHFVGEKSAGKRWSIPHYMMSAAVTSQGATFAYLSGSLYEYGFKDTSINTRLSVNWTRINFGDNGRWYRSGGYGYTFSYPQYDISTALSLAQAQLTLALLAHWPDGSRTGSSFTPSYTTFSLPSYSPSEYALYKGARDLVLGMPRFSIPAELEKQLYAECVEGQNCFTSNGIAFAQDIGKVGDSIRTLLATVANPTSPKQWASMWLSMRFSDRLTYQDSKELLEAIRGQLGRLAVNMSYKETHAHTTYDFSPSASHRISSYSISSNARLRCDNESYSGLMSAVKKMMEWDVWPSLENTWDMIPLSFVADWFLNLSTILTNVDRLVYEQYLRVRFYERSDKIRVQYTDEAIADAFGTTKDFLLGNVTGRYYYRRQAERPQLGILDGWSPSLPAPKNYVDSAALLVQML